MALLKDTITVALQVAFDSDPSADPPTWTTVASNTTKKLRSWQIRRGRNSTLDTFQAGTASFVLDNRDRLFDPLHAAGTYFGKLKPGKRVRLQVTYNGTTYTRFDGYVDGWPQTYPSPTVRDALVELRATDGFKRLGRNRARSVWEQEVIADSPRAWYRLGESSGTVAADSSGNAYHGTYVGGATFNARAGLVQFDPDGAIGFDGVDDRVDLPAASCAAGASFTVEAWIMMSEVGADDQVIWEQQAGASSHTLAVSGTVGDAGKVFFQHFTGTTADLATGTVRVDDGRPHHIVVVQTAATGGAIFLYVDDVTDGADASTAAAAGFTGATIGYGVSSNNGVALAGTGRFTGTIDELVVYDTALSAVRRTAHYDAGTAPWVGDTPGARTTKVLDAVAWSTTDRSIDTGRATLAPADLTEDVLSHLQAVALSEGGRFFISRDGKVTLVGRNEFWTETTYTTSQGTFSDDGAGLPYTGFGWDYSDDKVRNEIRINPQSGSEIVVADTTSQAEYGPIGFSQASLETDPGAVRGQAEWLLGKFKDAAFEVDRLDIDPLRSPAALFPVVLAAELGYRYTIERTPQGVGTQIAQDVHLEGTSEAGDSNSYRFSWLLSRAEPTVWIAGVGKAGVTTIPGY